MRTETPSNKFAAVFQVKCGQRSWRLRVVAAVGGHEASATRSIGVDAVRDAVSERGDARGEGAENPHLGVSCDDRWEE